MTKQEIIALIQAKAVAAGMDPKHALTIARIESSFDPMAGKGTGHQGLFQFGPEEWKQYGKGGDIFDPNAQADAFVGYHGDIKNSLAKTLGRDPTGPEMYLGWQQGAGGAGALLTNPDVPAASLIGTDAWAANGGKGPQTASGFGNMWRNRYNENQAALDGDTVDATSTPAAPNPDANIDQEIADWSKGPAAKPFDWTKAIGTTLRDLGTAAGGVGGGGGGGLLAQQPQPMMQGAPVQAHTPQGQAGLLNPFQQIDDLRRRQLQGLLGGM